MESATNKNLLGGLPATARIAAVKIARAGIWTISGGILAVALSFILGAGPCNATASGVVLLMLGLYVAIPIGAIALVIGLIIRARQGNSASSGTNQPTSN